MNKYVPIIIICLFIIIINIPHETRQFTTKYDTNFDRLFSQKPLIENYESLENCYYYGYPREFCLQVPIESKILPLTESNVQPFYKYNN